VYPTSFQPVSAAARGAQAERAAELEKKKERARRFNMPIAVTKEDVRRRRALPCSARVLNSSSLQTCCLRLRVPSFLWADGARASPNSEEGLLPGCAALGEPSRAGTYSSSSHTQCSGGSGYGGPAFNRNTMASKAGKPFYCAWAAALPCSGPCRRLLKLFGPARAGGAAQGGSRRPLQHRQRRRRRQRAGAGRQGQGARGALRHGRQGTGGQGSPRAGGG